MSPLHVGLQLESTNVCLEYTSRPSHSAVYYVYWVGMRVNSWILILVVIYPGSDYNTCWFVLIIKLCHTTDVHFWLHHHVQCTERRVGDGEVARLTAVGCWACSGSAKSHFELLVKGGLKKLLSPLLFVSWKSGTGRGGWVFTQGAVNMAAAGLP